MLVFLVLFVVLLLAGVPIAFTVGISSLGYLLTLPNPNILLSLPQKLYQGTDNFVLLAIPFFLLAGQLMNASGITSRLVGFLTVLLGHIRGCLAYANVLANMIFAGISGTATADAASIGSVMIPSMVKEGYRPSFAVAVTSAAATIGPVIPPSMFMIMYAVFANVSVAGMFMSGVIPGFLVGFLQLTIIYVIGRRAGEFPVARVRSTVGEVWTGFRDAILALVMPGIILGGLLGGIFTPTEGAVVAVVYAMFLGIFVYRTLTLRAIVEAFQNTCIVTGGLLFIAVNGFLFGWIMAAERVPELAAHWMLSISDSPWVFLALVNLLLLFAGAFIDEMALLIILVPVLFPISQQLGVDPIHFGLVICFNLVQGLIMPPLGILIFICAQIANIRIGSAYKALAPFLIANLLVLALITFVPTVALLLPRLLGL